MWSPDLLPQTFCRGRPIFCHDLFVVFARSYERCGGLVFPRASAGKKEVSKLGRQPA
jgi:hypothetical protein